MEIHGVWLLWPMGYSLPGSFVHGILQARILEWVAISSPGYPPNPGIEPRFPELQADFLPPEPPGKPLQNTLESPQYWHENKEDGIFSVLNHSCIYNMLDTVLENVQINKLWSLLLRHWLFGKKYKLTNKSLQYGIANAVMGY